MSLLLWLAAASAAAWIAAVLVWRDVQRDVLLNGEGRVYVVRWRWRGKHRVHLFKAGDPEWPHDHPFDFVAVALWGSAVETTFVPFRGNTYEQNGLFVVQRRRIRPLSVRRYKAKSIHRLDECRSLLTVVLVGKRTRHWGFWRPLYGGRSGGDCHSVREFVPHEAHERFRP